jgi:hypothetical protein
LFQGSLLFIATSSSSATVDSFSGKVFVSRLPSLHCNKLFISYSGSFSGKVFFKALFASLQQALHQLQWIRSAERFFKGSLRFTATSSSSAAVDLFSINQPDAVPETSRYALPIS